MEYKANEGKEFSVTVDGVTYHRIPVKTCVVTAEHNIVDVLREYAGPVLKPGDILFISEKMICCSQGRTVKLEDVEVSRLARLLSKYVEPTYSEGLGLPQTMQTAISEVGALRIIFAAAMGALGKIFHKRGWFYKIAGTRVSHIDGPSLRTIPPYDQQIVLSCLDPVGDATAIGKELGVDVAIIDANPIACTLCGASDPEIREEWLGRVLADNPLGQSTQRTPCGILRRAE